ncbi:MULTISPECIES: helix-turn-helix domain-containing protein [Exiguobacterium]|uniref:helix-turn-helix domain-containing protein n=1 Tax=Exiguobacterium TaxID=33986 RepID=UPI0004799E7D|nr:MULTISPECIES: helix-turn-helix domain-containing protein [Exiguobacterium]
MDQDVLKSLLNPIRMKIFQHVLMNEGVTTADLAKVLPDVPQASLYRHINKMVQDEILSVVSENKVRGVYEKVYAIQNNPLTSINKIVEKEDREQLYMVCYTFTMSLLMDFGNYLKRDSIDLQKDKVGFRSIPLYLSDSESDRFLKGLYDLLESMLEHEPSEERTLRKFSYAVMPVGEKEEAEDV